MADVPTLLNVDAYQITTLIAAAKAGRLRQNVTMSFFFRKMPKERDVVVLAGLRSVAKFLRSLQAIKIEGIGYHTYQYLTTHPVIGPALKQYPEVLDEIQKAPEFQISAMREGTFLFAGKGLNEDGEELPVNLYEPVLQITTSMAWAKLIETPILSRLNHASMVASKALRVVEAADGRPVLEFGQRRTHHEASVDASRAAYLAGCAGTSNLLAGSLYDIPTLGTMDHFYVMAAERPGLTKNETEIEAFRTFNEVFPGATLLVNTYDTWQGIRNAWVATGGKIRSIRIDSNVTVETVKRARALLNELGCPGATIVVSDGLDEKRVAELREAGADAFGVGENIVCSPDSAVGVGFVCKIVTNGYGKDVMKVSAGSTKATLPGRLQVYRHIDCDEVTTADESPVCGIPLLTATTVDRLFDLSDLTAAREHVFAQRRLGFARSPMRALVASAKLTKMIATEIEIH